MPADRGSRITDLFHQALAIEPAAREAFLNRACRGDHPLKEELSRLLAAHASGDSFLDSPAFAPADPPRLTPGTHLGTYSITAFIGAGGMGDVYRAHDSRLGRDVAIKILPPEAAADTDRRARFAREARAIATLNHPNIVTIHSVEQSEDLHFLTMELVEGKTLREQIPRGGFPIDRLLEIAIALADGIGAAHGQNVVHRDVKPANVMITPEGRIKVLDFGIAKLRTEAATAGDVATVSPPESTADGRVLGTVEYMSPEQAEGRAVDHRTDIFSIGVVLYEMATGLRPFIGESSASLLASILKDAPRAATELRPELPQALGRLIGRCLAKEPGRRYQSAVDLRNRLEEIQHDLADGSLTAAGSHGMVGARRRANRTWWIAASLLLLASASAAAYFAWLRPDPAPARILTTIAPPSGVEVTLQAARPILAISPDGRWVAFHGTSADPNRSGLYLRDLAALEPKYVADSGASSPFFFPDSRWLGFWLNGKIWKTRVDGGGREPVCNAPNELRGASWGDGGVIVFVDGMEHKLYRVPENGGAPKILTGTADRRGYFFPHVLPGGEHALVNLNGISLVSLQTGEILRTLIEEGSTPRYMDGGFLVFRKLETLYAVPFDLKGLNVAGDPQPVEDGVNFNPGNGASAFDISRGGTLVYVPAPAIAPEAALVWVDRQGQTEPVVGERRPFQRPFLDPTGRRRIAVHVANPGGNANDNDLWMYDIGNGSSRQLTHGQMTSGGIVWSADGQWIVFTSSKAGRRNLFRIPAEGGKPDQLTSSAAYGAFPLGWDFATSIYGNVLMFQRQVGPYDFDLLTMQLEPRGEPEPFLKIDERTTDGQISPDGRFVAYLSEDPGRSQVCVRSFLDRAQGPECLDSGSTNPRWSRTSRSLLFYRRDGEIWAIEVTPGGKGAVFHVDKPQVVVRTRGLVPGSQLASSFEPSWDDKQFLMIQRQRPVLERPLVYVPNWLDRVKGILRHPR